MAFEARDERRYWLNFAIRILLDLIVVFIIIYTFYSGENFWISYAILLFALWFIPILFIIKEFLYKLILYQFDKNERRAILTQEFRKMNLPLNEDWYGTSDSYFELLMSNDDTPIEIRNYSAVTIGQLQAISRHSFVDSFLVRSNLDAALSVYFDEIRRNRRADRD